MTKHLACMAILFLFFCSAHEITYATELQAKVVEVPNGGTIVVSYSNHFATVHLYTVVAPANDHPLAEVIRKHLADFVLGKTVRIRYSGMNSDVINGLVFLNGNDIGLQMVRDGAARYNSKYERELSDVTRQLYAQSEQAARNEGLGIWQANLTNLPQRTSGDAKDTVLSHTSPGTSAVSLGPRESGRYASPYQRIDSVNNSVIGQFLNSFTPQTAKSVVWTQGAPGSDDLFSEGQYFRILEAEGIEIVVTMYDGDDHRVADVFISNRSDKRKLVDPTMSRFTVTDSGRPMVLFSPIPPEKIASKIKRRAKWVNVLAAILSSVPQSTASQSSTHGSVSVYGITALTLEASIKKRPRPPACLQMLWRRERQRKTISAGHSKRQTARIGFRAQHSS